MQLRRARPGDEAALVSLQLRLWPDGEREEMLAEAAAVLAGKPRSTLPLVVFVAEEASRLIAFVEVGLRSHADGCDTSRPCGFLEGWYVEPEYRKTGVGGALVRLAEEWCREQGCTELASDTWIDENVSEQAHTALGFEVVDRCIHFRKSL